MNEFIEKLIGRLEELDKKTYRISPKHAIKIVNQLAEEYNGGWIPCSEPPKNFMLSDGRYIPFLVCDDLIWHPYIAFYNGTKWTKAFATEKPNFWQPLPPKYEPKGE